MALQSALCICSRKWKTKLIVPMYFGTKTAKTLKIVLFGPEFLKPREARREETFHVLSKTYSLMCHYNHSLSVDAKIMVSTNCPIICEQVAVNFVAQ